MLVKFKRSWRNYNGEEVAGFDEAMTESLISSGIAEMFDPDVVEAEADEADTGAGLPDQGGQESQAEPAARKRGGKVEAEALPLQGAAAETVAGGDGADTVAGGAGA
jgi:hypothetical protein